MDHFNTQEVLNHTANSLKKVKVNINNLFFIMPFFMLSIFFLSGVNAQDKLPWEEYDRRISSAQNISVLPNDVFGDSVSLFNGVTSFSHTDLDVSGSSGLPVRVSRNLQITNAKGDVKDEIFADWEIDIPRISGVFSTPGWVNPVASKQLKRCSIESASEGAPPFFSVNFNTFKDSDYWSGTSIDLPGRGSEQMLFNSKTISNPQRTESYHWVTSSLTYVSCLPTIKNGQGEGFIAITPDGTRYWFDWLTRFAEQRMQAVSSNKYETTLVYIPRYRNVMYATRVEDRFGNWVNYEFNTSTAMGASRQLKKNY